MAHPPRQMLYEVPSEVINAIVDLVANPPGDAQKQDLKALSLTSPVFLSSARLHLFYQSTFYLAPDDIDGKFKSTLFLLDHSPHIAPFIRSLRILKPDVTHLKAKNLLCTSVVVAQHEMALCRFLHLLNNLQELHIDNLEFCVFPTRKLDQTTAALKSCLFRNPIQHLGIGHIINFPMDILPCLPLLSLSLRELQSSVYFPLPDIEETPKLSLTLRNLHILAFDDQTAVRSWITNKRPFSLSNITSLTIPATNFETGAKIALLCSSTLTLLKIEGFYGHGETLNLSLLPALQFLTLKLESCNDGLQRSTSNSPWVGWLISSLHTVDSSVFREGRLIVRVVDNGISVQYDPLKPDVDQFDALFARVPAFTFTLANLLVPNFSDSEESEVESEYEYDDEAYLSYDETRDEDDSEYEESGPEDAYEHEYYAIQNEQPQLEGDGTGNEDRAMALDRLDLRELATVNPFDVLSDDADHSDDGHVNVWLP